MKSIHSEGLTQSIHFSLVLLHLKLQVCGDLPGPPPAAAGCATSLLSPAVRALAFSGCGGLLFAGLSDGGLEVI